MSDERDAAIRAEIVALPQKYPLTSPQDAVNDASAYLTTGLAFADSAVLWTQGETLLTAKDAEAIKSGLLYLIVPNMPDNENKTVVTDLLDVFILLLLSKAATMTAEQKSDLTAHLATFFGDAAALLIDSTLGKSLGFDACEILARQIGNAAITAAINGTMAAIELSNTESDSDE
jgi:hypothetical protein